MHVIIYWFFILIVILIEVFRKKQSKIDFFTIFGFNFLLSYLIPSALWISFPNTFSEKLPYTLFYNPTKTLELSSALLISYFTFFIFYTIFTNIKLPFYITADPLYAKEKIYTKIIIIMTFFSLLVLLGILMMSGITPFIIAGIEARHNHSGYGIVGYFRYFYSSFPVIFIAITLFYIYRKELKFRYAYYPLLLFTILTGIIALVSNGGRSSLVNVGINILFFLYMIGKIRFRLKIIIIGLTVFYFSLFVISELHSIAGALIRGVDVNLIDRFMAFPYKVSNAILSVFQYSAHYLFIIVELFKNSDIYNYPRLGSDNISGILLLVPGLDTQNIGFYDLPDNISQGVMGKSNGAIPPGWIGWDLLNGGYLWLFIKLIYSAYLAATLDKSKKYLINSIGYGLGSYIYFVIILLFYNLLFSVTATNLIRSNIGLLLFFTLLCFLPITRILRVKLIKGNRL